MRVDVDVNGNSQLGQRIGTVQTRASHRGQLYSLLRLHPWQIQSMGACVSTTSRGNPMATSLATAVRLLEAGGCTCFIKSVSK
mmetsp:Transcript_30080/g.54876  ORF Transcript_30080/g.54876 Transcript_30080/m.54876 type:complete len:83 (-) Transcript_30080:815-1063(-)